MAVFDEPWTSECETLERLRAVLAAARPSPERRIAQALDLIEARLAQGDTVESKTVPVIVDRADADERRPAGSDALDVDLVGRSTAMRDIEHAIQRVSQSSATVLIRGESGTGKEVVARAIHQLSDRASGPFVPLHCAAVTDTLLESELFGHERGAFTGAQEQRKGKFEMAHGGTLFLDEIGDIPVATQIKLLRVLQDRRVERVGGGKPVPIDVRVVSATHRDLEAMIAAGAFREDLYYRVNVVPIVLPPLRARHGDIPVLIASFLDRLNAENRRQVSLAPDVLRLMERYHWPGNVRELQNCIERLVVLAPPGREEISLDTIPPSLRGYFHDMRQVTGRNVDLKASAPVATRDARRLTDSVQDLERERLVAALNAAGWIQTRAARALGLSARQVAYKIRKYGLRQDEDLIRGSEPHHQPFNSQRRTAS